MAGAARALGPRARYQRIVEYIWLAAEFGEGLRALVGMAYKLQSMRRLGLDVEGFCRDVSKAYAEAHDICHDEVLSTLEKLRYDEEAGAFYLEGEDWEAYAVLVDRDWEVVEWWRLARRISSRRRPPEKCDFASLLALGGVEAMVALDGMDERRATRFWAIVPSVPSNELAARWAEAARATGVRPKLALKRTERYEYVGLRFGGEFEVEWRGEIVIGVDVNYGNMAYAAIRRREDGSYGLLLDCTGKVGLDELGAWEIVELARELGAMVAVERTSGFVDLHTGCAAHALRFVATSGGVPTVVVDNSYNSQVCIYCGRRVRVVGHLAICEEHGEMDKDVNAAANAAYGAWKLLEEAGRAGPAALPRGWRCALEGAFYTRVAK